MPEEVKTTTTEATPQAVEGAQPTGTAQEQARTQVYAQYADLYKASEVTPQAESTPSEPVAEPAPVAAAAPEPVDYTSVIQQQQQALEALRAELDAIKPKPVTPTPAEPVREDMEAWIELAAQGKYGEAKQALISMLAPIIQEKIQPNVVKQSVETANAEQDINKFISTFETENQDLMPVRDYVVMGAERRLQAAQSEGKIKSTADFVREYKAAVTTEANELRQKFQIARSAGKEAAMVTQREVLSATTMEPTGIAQPVAPKPQQTIPTAADYIASRQNRMATLQGMR